MDLPLIRLPAPSPRKRGEGTRGKLPVPSISVGERGKPSAIAAA
ncbi:hypothetical protein AOX55_0000231 [Sinorhizobium fredii CCBAU 25509]|nr:hypothetical protein SF83666_c01830 [Sinorhizobium fredii CCBAU 83666]AWM23514.1 hypothetical protein AOX55_0000231 [Sinorhizobium fredii CCBAU 25509]